MMETRERHRPAVILLVEDNPADARMTLEMLSEGPVAKRVRVVRDGEEALSVLRHAGRRDAMPRPDLVILDLNLPRRDGREVLAEMKTDPGLRSIPVIVLTTSSAQADVSRVYDLHANCYIVKPLALDAFAAAIRSIEQFWLSVVRLPGDSESGQNPRTWGGTHGDPGKLR